MYLRALFVLVLVASSMVLQPSLTECGLSGQIIVAGYGPERPLIERLARAFEKANPGRVITIKWDRNLKAVAMLKANQAQVAVTGEIDPEWAATTIAWDGIAVIVNFSNAIKEVTRQQVADLFRGKFRLWSELGGAEAKIELIHRPPDRNIRAGFEQALGIDGQAAKSGKVIRSDHKTLSTVGGNLSAVTYISLQSALEAVQFGMPISVLIIDGIDPGEPTVKNGQYKLRRAVLLLTSRQPDPVTAAFIVFARSLEGQRIVDEIFIPYSL